MARRPAITAHEAGPVTVQRTGPRFTIAPQESGEQRLTLSPAGLAANPRNARLHPPRQIDELRRGLRKFGQVKPVVIDQSGRVLAGHGLLAAARAEGLPSVWVTVCTLDELRAQAYAIADNRTAELSDWDTAALADALADLGNQAPELVQATGFDDRELRELLEASTAALMSPTRSAAMPSTSSSNGVADPDAPKRDYSMQDRPPMLASGAAVSRRGDVWNFGAQRLACGDARDERLVRTVLAGVEDFVLVADPPYCSGSSQEAGKAAGTFGDIAADNLSAQGFRELIRESIAACGAQHVYFFTDWRQWPNLVQIVEGSGLAARAMLVWDKGAPGIGAFWRPTHELVLFATRRTAKRAAGAVGLANVLRFKRARNLHHYTEKPVDLLARILLGDEATGRVGAPVYDPFAGSGSTLLAAAQAGRKSYGIEVEPLVVDTALRRMRDVLNVSPTLIASAEWDPGTFGQPGARFEKVSEVRLGRREEPTAPAKKKRKAAPAAEPAA